MKVKAVYFAQIREAKGKGEEILEIPAGSSAGDLRSRIVSDLPDIAGLERQISLAVNMEIVNDGTALREGDEVALLLPFSGG
jgi:molybdopterin converting factor small subunit